jgi:EAL domain-containing protein (putative c-di-GMP-specific phosphodiesterase class I)
MHPNRLLVIDDEPDIRDFIKVVAEDIGFEVTEADNQVEFQAALQSFSPTVIVLDLMMPGVDGVELLRLLVKKGCRARILLISGLDPRVLNTANRLGSTLGLNMAATLHKPMSIPELETALRKTLQEGHRITESDLKEALAEEQLLLYYQPKVSLESDRVWEVEGVEALVRWQHPKFGLLSPDEFIPLAEKTGLIRPLTEFVLKASLEQVRIWSEEGLEVSVAVNLSPHLIDDLELPDRIADLQKEYGLKGSPLSLEITESAVMKDAAHTMDILIRFRMKGIELSLDDFGTGYSSLVQLYRMPFSELKIDKSFVMEANESEEAATIVRSIANLGHNLGLTICAEGVENQEALDLLRSVGCEKAQGYFMSRPLGASDETKLLRKWAAG